jgi:hypothetical protein
MAGIEITKKKRIKVGGTKQTRREGAWEGTYREVRR